MKQQICIDCKFLTSKWILIYLIQLYKPICIAHIHVAHSLQIFIKKTIASNRLCVCVCERGFVESCNVVLTSFISISIPSSSRLSFSLLCHNECEFAHLIRVKSQFIVHLIHDSLYCVSLMMVSLSFDHTGHLWFYTAQCKCLTRR